MPFTVKNSSGTAVNFRQDTVRYTSKVNARGTLRFDFTTEYPPTLEYVTGSAITLYSGTTLTPANAGSAVPLNVGEDVYVHDGSDDKLWGGTVEAIDESDLTKGTRTYRHLKYTAVDFAEMAGRWLVAESFSAQTAGAIVSSLRASYLDSEGVTAGTISDGPVIQSIVFNYRTLEQCFDELAELAGFSWWIDEDKALQFRARAELTAPISITATSRPYLSLNVERTRSKYRNIQYVRAGYDLTSSQAETFVGDGERRTFTASYPVGAAPTIEVDTGGGYASKTVGVNGVDTGKEWYYNLGSANFTQSTTETVLSSAHTVRITYQGRYPIIIKAEDQDEITARAAIESGTGTYESVVDTPDIDDDEVAEDKAAALLSRFGSIPVSVTFETDTSGLCAGQLLPITLPEHDLDDTFLIESCRGFERGDLELRYSVKAISRDADGGWVQYFKNLAASGKTFVIRENEVLVIVRTPKDGLAIADSPSTATSTSSGFTVGAATAIVGLVDVG